MYLKIFVKNDWFLIVDGHVFLISSVIVDFLSTNTEGN